MFGAKLGKLWSAQFLPKHNLSIPARAVQLENVLCQINANDDIFFHGCSLSLWWWLNNHHGTSRCRSRRGHPPHQFR
jgi:hypothetical protein